MKRTFFHFVLAILFLFCLNGLYFSFSEKQLYFSYNILTFFLLISLVLLFNKGAILYKKLGKGRRIFLLCSFFFSFFFTAGTSLVVNNAVTFSSPLFWGSMVVFTLFFLYLLTVLYCIALPKAVAWLTQPLSARWEKCYSHLHFIQFMALIFVLWIPILLACYPGIFSYDAQFQSNQIIGNIPLNAHHPVIHTLLLGGCLALGESLFHSYNTGMLFYSLIQISVLSASMAYVLSFMKKRNTAPKYVILCFLFFSLMPFNSILSVCATKDTIFSALFLVYITFWIRLASEHESFFASRFELCFFTLSSFLLMTLRKNMLYVILFCVPFLFFIYRKYWKKLLWIILLPLLLIRLVEGPIYDILQIKSGDSREAYSVIIQQFGSVYPLTEPGSEEQELLLDLMDEEDWLRYEPRRADALKDHFHTTVFEDNLTDYLSLWLELGIAHPSQYINAFLNTTFGLWYPNDILPDTATYRKYIEVYCNGAVTFDSKFPLLLKVIEHIGMESIYQYVPGISILFSPGFYLWILMFGAAIGFYSKKYKNLIPFIPLLGLFCTLLLGPVAILRYMYPLLLSAPLISSLLLYSAKKEPS